MKDKQCKKCGNCCRAIWVPVSRLELLVKYNSKVNDDINFAVRNWKPISKEKAFKKNPNLEIWPKHETEDFFYECKHFDELTNTCIVHNCRPDVCRNFLYYGKDKLSKDFQFYSENCGFK